MSNTLLGSVDDDLLSIGESVGKQQNDSRGRAALDPKVDCRSRSLERRDERCIKNEQSQWYQHGYDIPKLLIPLLEKFPSNGISRFIF